MIRSPLSLLFMRRNVATRTGIVAAAVTSLLIGHSLSNNAADAAPPKKITKPSFTKPSFTPRSFQPKPFTPRGLTKPQYQKPSTIRPTYPNVKSPSPKPYSRPQTFTPPRNSFKPQFTVPQTVKPRPNFRPAPKRPTPSLPGNFKLPGTMQTLPGRVKPGGVLPPRVPGSNSQRPPQVPTPRPNFGSGSSNLTPKLPQGMRPNIKDLIQTPKPQPRPRIPDLSRPDVSAPAGNNQKPLLPGGFIPRNPRLPEGFLPGGNNGGNDEADNSGSENENRPRRPDLSELIKPRPRVPDNLTDIIRPEDLRPRLPEGFGGGNAGQNSNDGDNDGEENNGQGDDADGNNAPGNDNPGQPDANVPPMELPPEGDNNPGNEQPEPNVPSLELPPGHDDHGHHDHFPPAIIIDLICNDHGAGYCPPGFGFPGVGQSNVILEPGVIVAPPVDHGPLVNPIEEADLPRLPRVENGDEITLLLEQPVVLEADVSLRAVLVIGDRPMVVEITSPVTATAVPGEPSTRTVVTVAVQLPTLLTIDDLPATILLGLSDTGEVVLEQPFVIVPLG